MPLNRQPLSSIGVDEQIEERLNAYVELSRRSGLAAHPSLSGVVLMPPASLLCAHPPPS
jgi:hypothetical protein